MGGAVAGALITFSLFGVLFSFVFSLFSFLVFHIFVFSFFPVCN